MFSGSNCLMGALARQNQKQLTTMFVDGGSAWLIFSDTRIMQGIVSISAIDPCYCF